MSTQYASISSRKVEQHIRRIMETTSGTTCTLNFDNHDHTLIRAMAKRFEHSIDGEDITFILTQEKVRRENLKPLVNAVRIDTEGNLHIPPAMSGASVKRWLTLNADAMQKVRMNIEDADPSTLEPSTLEIVTETAKGNRAGFTIKGQTSGYMVSLPGYEFKISVGRRSVHLAQKAAAVLMAHTQKISNDLRLLADAYDLSQQDIDSLTLGGWVNEGFLYLDLSINVSGVLHAKRLGKNWSQIAVFDCRNQISVEI